MTETLLVSIYQGENELKIRLNPLSMLIATVVLTGCGGNTSTALGLDTNPRIRVANAISTPVAASITVNSQSVINGAAFGYSSDYSIYTNGNLPIQYLDPTTSAQLVTASPLFQLNGYYTLIGYNTSPTAYGSLVLSDTQKPTGSSIGIRVANVAATTGPVDVYITAPGADISTSTATVSSVPVGDANQSYTSLASGTYLIRITPPGSKTILTQTTVTLSSAQTETVILANNASSSAQLIDLPSRQF